MNAIILAAGYKTKNLPEPKALIHLFDGTTILSRQVAQLRSHGIQDIIVAINPDFRHLFKKYGPRYVKYIEISHEKYDFVETLITLKDHINNTILLLGDVIMTNRSCDEIFKQEFSDILFVGSKTDTYAILFRGNEARPLTKADLYQVNPFTPSDFIDDIDNKIELRFAIKYLHRERNI